MRGIVAKDIFALSRIAEKMNLDLSKVRGKDKKISGIELFKNFFENLGKAEKEVTVFLAGVSGKTEKEISNMPLKELKELVKELFQDEEIVNFFKSQTQ